MYPLPQSAVAVTLGPNGLNIYLPPTREGGKGHTIVIPADAAGMKALVDILHAREAGEVAFATRGAPTQRQVIDPRILEGVRHKVAAKGAAAAQRKAEQEAKRLDAMLKLRELGL